MVGAAILRAVLYADIFDYPLTLEEIHRYLEGAAASVEEVKSVLASSAWLAARVAQVDGFYSLPHRQALAALRRQRKLEAARLWPAAYRYGRLMAHLPFVRMVAVTGALAMDNVIPGDDIDFLIVAVPGRVWTARAFAILMVRLARLTGVALCPNYILDETALAQARRDLFVAHELAQMTPVAGQAVYWQMRAANAWLADFLPNAAPLPRAAPDLAPRGLGRFVQRLAEQLFSGSLGERLEHWERRRKIVRFQKQLQQAGSAAVLDESQVKGHFNDYGRNALAAYEARLTRYNSNYSALEGAAS